ncbi:hypothetical protein ACLK1T_05485 [Escherichia coli]
MLLAGDAAHYAGLAGSGNQQRHARCFGQLAWKLALVINGKADNALLIPTSRNAATTPKR